jgi:membrane-associated phospholipid phosphatase
MARRSLLVALACVVLGAAVWLVAARTGWGARLDSAGLEGFTGLATPERERVADVVSRSVDPTPFVVIGAAITCIALARRRLREALAVIVMLAGGSYTAQLLQSLLAGPRPHPAVDFRVGEAAWPSGHTTAALGLALCLVLVAPPRLRPVLAALGGLFVVAVVDSLMLLGWHYPSDVIGGFCLACFWLALGVAALRATDARAGAGTLRLQAVLLPAALAALLVAAVVAVVLVRPAGGYGYLQEHPTFVWVAVLVGAGALALSAGTAAALGRAG